LKRRENGFYLRVLSFPIIRLSLHPGAALIKLISEISTEYSLRQPEYAEKSDLQENRNTEGKFRGTDNMQKPSLSTKVKPLNFWHRSFTFKFSTPVCKM
jgi:hypothetical protein